jgi:hypothetical protein
MPTSKWKTAFENAKNYRDFLAEQEIPDQEKSKAFLLTKEDISALLTQDNTSLDGIRIYVGHELYENGSKAVRLYIVGAFVNGDVYEDYKIPADDVYNRITDLDTDPVLDEARPCPTKCSPANGLNS